MGQKPISWLTKAAGFIIFKKKGWDLFYEKCQESLEAISLMLA